MSYTEAKSKTIQEGIFHSMKLSLCLALLLQLILIYLEIRVLKPLKKKCLLRYYTYLQNFLTLVTSCIFAVCLAAVLVFDADLLPFARGLRYTATCGLTFAAFVYIVLLHSNPKNRISQEDFAVSVDPWQMNLLLHVICPAVSLISFAGPERSIPMDNAIWTGIAAIPSCLYWVVYLFLSAAHLWQEPYDFSAAPDKKKNVLADILIVVSIPIAFIIISSLLWSLC